jgi:hypothetical protein
MHRRALLRASDQDREHVAERLRTAALEGRLTSEELEERLGRAYAGRTYGELDELLADLPVPASPPARRANRSVTRAPRHRPPVLAAAAGGLTVLLVALLAIAHSGGVVFGHGASAAGAIPTPGGGRFVHAFAGFALARAAAAAFAGLCLVVVVLAVVGWMVMRPWSTRDA